jgi:hypothetical protein
VALNTLRKHVVDWSDKFCIPDLATDACPSIGSAVATIDRRLDAQVGSAQAPVHNSAYRAAYALEPFHIDVEDEPDGSFCSVPALTTAHLKETCALVLRMGGAKAAAQLARLFTQGFPKGMQSFVGGTAGERIKAEACQDARVIVLWCQEARSAWRCGLKLGRMLPSFTMWQCACYLRVPQVQHQSATGLGRYCAARSSLGM